MIYCECNCIYAIDGKCIKDSIVNSSVGCLNLSQKVITRCDNVTPEFAENLKIGQIIKTMCNLSDALMGIGDIKSSISDVLNGIEELKAMYGISNDDLHRVIIDKFR